MRVRTQLELWQGSRTFAPILVGGGVVMAASPLGFGLALASGVVAALVTTVVHRRLEGLARSNLLMRKHRQLASATDPRAVFEEIAEGYRMLKVPPDLYLKMTGAYVLLQENRWAEARAQLEALDLTDAAPSDRVTCRNNLAWAMAHDGFAAQAVELAEQTLAEARSLGAPALSEAAVEGTLGCALTLAGRHQAALAPLEHVLAVGGTVKHQAIRHYYLGHALFALNRVDDARKHWEECRRLLPGSHWAKLAEGSLQKPSPPAYR